MPCPFLHEVRAKYCGTSPVRSLIPIARTSGVRERCSSEAHCECKVFQEQSAPLEAAATSGCPYLHESLMQYCGAASVTRFVPYSEALLSRCGNEGHRYCDLYLQMAHPDPQGRRVEGLAMPEWLQYTANHMWLDTTGDGQSHVGIDSFLSRALGAVDRISFVQQKGRVRPTAVVTLNGIDLEITFPFPISLTGCNLYLRANPAKLTAEPYTGGWLFEGVADPSAALDLASGDTAGQWMSREVRRMSEFLQEMMPGPAGATAMDGGIFSEGLARHVERDQMRALFHEFFSPYASRNRL